MFKKSLAPLILSLISGGCAVVHKVQIAEIDQTFKSKSRPIEVLISEVGISTEELGATARMISTNKQSQQKIKELQNIISLFQWGPRTGNITYVRDYADSALTSLVNQCPSGKITNILSVREMTKYPVVSGEIIKVKALCYE